MLGKNQEALIDALISKAHSLGLDVTDILTYHVGFAYGHEKDIEFYLEGRDPDSVAAGLIMHYKAQKKT